MQRRNGERPLPHLQVRLLQHVPPSPKLGVTRQRFLSVCAADHAGTKKTASHGSALGACTGARRRGKVDGPPPLSPPPSLARQLHDVILSAFTATPPPRYLPSLPLGDCATPRWPSHTGGGKGSCDVAGAPPLGCISAFALCRSLDLSLPLSYVCTGRCLYVAPFHVLFVSPPLPPNPSLHLTPPPFSHLPSLPPSHLSHPPRLVVPCSSDDVPRWPLHLSAVVPPLRRGEGSTHALKKKNQNKKG